MARIITVTLNPCIDKSSRVGQVVPERKLRCAEPHFEPGGGGLNVSRTVKELGGQSLAIWCKGGYVGDQLHDLLDDYQLEHHPIPIARMTRVNLIVAEDASGQQFRFGMPGPPVASEEADRVVEAVCNTCSEDDLLVISGSMPPGLDERFIATLMHRARAKSVIVDTSGETLKHALSVGVLLLKPNLRELSDIVGVPLESDEQICDEARKLIAEGKTQAVVISLGSAGALLVMKEECEKIPSPTVRIRSKVGAGDSMVGAMAWQLAQGASIKEAVRWGVAAGAATVMTSGTQLCRRADVERLHGQIIKAVG